MRRTSQQTSKQRRRVSAGVLVFLVGYVLNLCTLNPLIHAALPRHLGEADSTVSAHCTLSSAVVVLSAPMPAGQGPTPEPLCCEFRGGNNKALASAFAATDVFPILSHSLVPWDERRVVAGAPSLPSVQARPASRPPPLYLVHAALLI
jgi:hypothetical protein